MGWVNLHFSFFQSKEMKELVLLDSESTDTVFCNKNYVSNIRKANKPLILKTYGGEIVTTEICDIPYLGTQWFNKNAVTNIIILADIAEKYQVTMDTEDEKSFTVYLPNKTANFPQMRGGLYARNPQESKQFFQLTSILKNKKQDNFVMKEKTRRALAARKLQKAMGFLSQEDVKKGVRLNLIKNSNVTCADIDLANEFYGIDIATKKGKIVRKKILEKQFTKKLKYR